MSAAAGDVSAAMETPDTITPKDPLSYITPLDQRQKLNRFNRFVIGDDYAREAAHIHPRSREEAKRRETTFDLIERVHEAESSKLPPVPTSKHGKWSKAKRGGNEQTQPASEAAIAIEPAHRFEVTLEPDTFTNEKYEVFENYQRIVHKEPPSKISKRGFASFLCNSPIRRETHIDEEGRQRQLGSFHQCYRLDGRLVAIGVLDLLPNCVSSVYFLYHESVHTHSPGKLSAMREIALARELNYRWWYSGYYIHGCPKMRYKLDFLPQYVLDPELVASWDLLDKEALEIFDKQAYVSFSHERVSAYKREMDRLRANGTPHKYDIFAFSEALSFHGGPRVTAPTPAPVADASTREGNTGQTEESSNAASEDEGDDDETNAPLFTSNMPGLPSMSDIANLWLDKLPVYTSHQPEMFPINHLVAWDEGTFTDNKSFKNKVAELVAMLGPDLRDRLCVDFRRYNN
ncbi:Arginyl-tRNA--protein transferase 1 [Sporothrix eucalyptigena]|uniref:Arginyl-tRNA--protein transferase 1 n=1 Tax=Sporothrix eucalyptigena TaxID=1812306 RepID=A0ABP0BND1_9PEZI